MQTIDEFIADAKAEEEVKRRIGDITPVSDKMMIPIDMDELIKLKLKLADYERLMQVIIANARLSWNDKSLITEGDLVMDAFKLLYPDEYEGLYERLKEKRENGSVSGDSEVDG